MIRCVPIGDVVIPIDNTEGLQKVLLSMRPKFVSYFKRKFWDMESLATVTFYK